jgi:RNA polymerase sigma-70 factor (ECF subfamily)
MDGATQRRLRDEVLAHGLALDPEVVSALQPALATTPDALSLGDLYLATACRRGDNAALRRFEAAYGALFDRAIRRSPGLGFTEAEFRQLVLDRLFVPREDTPPRISKYEGRGSLEGWLRVMTSRLVIDLSRRKKQPSTAGDERLVERMEDDQDTELAVLRHRYGPMLEQAFSAGLGALTIRQRNLLRQRYLHEVSADALAKVYGVHRATLFGWLEKARVALLLQVRQALAAAVPGDQLESVVGLLGSDLHLSVRRLLDSNLETEG